jgi:hypothetical protein
MQEATTRIQVDTCRQEAFELSLKRKKGGGINNIVFSLLKKFCPVSITSFYTSDELKLSSCASKSLVNVEAIIFQLTLKYLADVCFTFYRSVRHLP